MSSGHVDTSPTQRVCNVPSRPGAKTQARLACKCDGSMVQRRQQNSEDSRDATDAMQKKINVPRRNGGAESKGGLNITIRHVGEMLAINNDQTLTHALSYPLAHSAPGAARIIPIPL